MVICCNYEIIANKSKSTNQKKRTRVEVESSNFIFTQAKYQAESRAVLNISVTLTHADSNSG